MIRKVLKSYGSVRYIFIQPFFFRSVFVKHCRRIAFAEEIRNFFFRVLLAVCLYPRQKLFHIVKLRHLNSPPALCYCFRVGVSVYKAGENKSPLKVDDLCLRRFVFKTFLCGSHTDKFPVFNADCLCVFFFLIAFIYFSVK